MRFKEGREEEKDDFKNETPLTSLSVVNVEWVRQVVCDDRRLTVRMNASQLDMKKGCVWKIISEDFGMPKVCTKMVIRSSTTYRCFLTASNVFELNKIWFKELSVVMRDGYLRTTRNQAWELLVEVYDVAVAEESKPKPCSKKNVKLLSGAGIFWLFSPELIFSTNENISCHSARVTSPGNYKKAR